jgi:hypothetical protein
MSTQIQYRRGSSAQTASFTGALGEITVDTTNKVVVVHDGSTLGGFAGVSTTASQTLTNKTLSSPVVTGTVTANGGTGSSGQYLESTGSGVRWSTVDATQIFSGTSSLAIISSGGNIRANIGGATIETISSGGISVTGNVTLSGNIIDTGPLTVSTSSNGNITFAPNGTGVVIVNTDLRNGQANGVGNIGTTGGFFNTVFAKSTSAQYADVAEQYLADADYPVGTVLVIGGDKEVTQSTGACQTSVAGTISENPGVLMNRGLEGEHVAAVALLGRVPCRVIGTINKGDLLMSSEIPGVACKLENYTPGCVIGKALANHTVDTEGTIEIMVGRL